VPALATPLWDISTWLRPCFRLLFVLIVDESVISRVALGPLGNKGLQATLLRPGSGTFREPGGGGGGEGRGGDGIEPERVRFMGGGDNF
jgi:hypothetical protein